MSENHAGRADDVLDEQVRAHLQRAYGPVEPSPALAQRVRQSLAGEGTTRFGAAPVEVLQVSPRPRRSWRGALLCAAAVSAVAIGATIALSGSPDRDPAAPIPAEPITAAPSTQANLGPTMAELAGSWVVADVTGRDLVPGTPVTLEIDGDGHIEALAGCNRIQGTLALSGNRFSAEPLGITEAGCEPSLADQEIWYLGWLSSGPEVERTPDTLVLSADGVTVTYRLQAHSPDVSTALADLVGEWESHSVSGRHLVNGRSLTITIAADGAVWAFAGCNSLDATAELSGDRLRLTGGGLTEMGCGDPWAEIDAQDKWYQAWLHDGVTTVRSGSELILSGAGVTVTYGSKGDSTVPAPALSLEDLTGDWESSVVEGRELVAGTQLTISVEAGRVGGRAGCNYLGGTGRVVDSVLIVDDLHMTLMGCSGDLVAQDGWYSTWLGSGLTLARAGAEVSLSGAGVTVTYRKVLELEEPDSAVANPTGSWESDEVEGRELVSDTLLELDFPSSGLWGRAGCRGFSSAEVEFTGTTMTVGEMAIRQPSCGSDRDDQESWYAGWLSAGVTVEMTGDELVLSGGGVRATFRPTDS